MSAQSSKLTVVVTGSRSGIGAAIGRRLATDGWSVIGVDLATDVNATWLTDQRVVDLSDTDQIRNLVSSLSGVQALVHAAGFMRTGTLETLDPADGERMWAVHVRALVLLASSLCPRMSPGGRLLAIGSRTSRGSAGKSQYAACKAAVTALVRSWAAEYVGRGITANVIAPAATSTPMLSGSNRAAVPPVLPPIGRYIEPDEIAAYASFLLSPDAAAITGQELLVCGGASL